MKYLIATLCVPIAVYAQEPTPRLLSGQRIPLSGKWATVSGVAELRDGRLLVSDATSASVFIIDPSRHTQARVGSAGGDPLQYAQPGGFYGGLADSILLLDRGLSKVLVFAPGGTIARSWSTKEEGISSSSDADEDRQRVDAKGMAYFPVHQSSRAAVKQGDITCDSSSLDRFDPVRQHHEPIATLRGSLVRVVQASANFQMGQAIVGSPVDEWGVASDGSVAVVRGAPYRVEWYPAGGRVVRGPEIAVSRIDFTGPERDSIAAAAKTDGGVSASSGGTSVSSADVQLEFAEPKPAFVIGGVFVSPAGHVWVARTQAFRANGVVFDVFDRKGDRLDRVRINETGHIVGATRTAIYVKGVGADGQPILTRYDLR